MDPDTATDIVLSHNHPDHTMNIALFPQVRVHDFMAIYEGDIWTERDAEGCSVSPSVQLIKTPGHSYEDLTTLVTTDQGLWPVPICGGQRAARRKIPSPRTNVPSIGRAGGSWTWVRRSSFPGTGRPGLPSPDLPAGDNTACDQGFAAVLSSS